MQPGLSGAGGLENSTTAAFQMLEAVVGAIGGFAQMLESTYMATHSSFFAMVGVAEQVAALRRSLIGSASVGLLALWRVFVRIWNRITGRASSAATTTSKSKDGLSMRGFDQFRRGEFTPGSSGTQQQQPRVSIWPLVVFLGAVFGGPYLMSKLIKALAASRQQDDMRLSAADGVMLGTAANMSAEEIAAQQAAAAASAAANGVGGGVLNGSDLIIDPSKLEFCRAVYDFAPENEAIELGFKKGEIIAILSKDMVSKDDANSPTWWRGRLRNGKMGFFPSNYVQNIKRPPNKNDENVKPE